MSEPEFVVEVPDETHAPQRGSSDLTGWESVIFVVEDEE